MSITYQIRNWLQTAFTEQVDLINESYFFDKRDNEFYSVFITDYFLMNATSGDEYSDSPYSKNEMAILSERINRQEKNDPSILFIPRLTIEERTEMMQAFLSNQHLQNKEELQSIITAENGRTKLDFNNRLPAIVKDEWQKFKYKAIQDKIDSFCNLYNLDLATATLWTDKKMTSLNLGDNSKTEVIKGSKPWWKFW